MRSRCSVAPTHDHAWTGPTGPCSPPSSSGCPRGCAAIASSALPPGRLRMRGALAADAVPTARPFTCTTVPTTPVRARDRLRRVRIDGRVRRTGRLSSLDPGGTPTAPGGNASDESAAGLTERPCGRWPGNSCISSRSFFPPRQASGRVHVSMRRADALPDNPVCGGRAPAGAAPDRLRLASSAQRLAETEQTPIKRRTLIRTRTCTVDCICGRLLLSKLPIHPDSLCVPPYGGIPRSYLTGGNLARSPQFGDIRSSHIKMPAPRQ
jgi:hypothetical protein